MVCLVTGGAGFIGSHLVEKLIEQNLKVVVLDNLSSGKLENLKNVRSKISFIRDDIRNFSKLKKVMEEKIDIIYHLAALVSVPRSFKHPKVFYETNVDGTMNVLEISRINDIERLVFASSAAVYGNNQNLPLKEELPYTPTSPYGLSKVIGEMLCLSYAKLYGLKISILRYFNVYGPRQDPNSPYSGVITKFVNCIKNHIRPTIYGDGTQTRDFIYVKDVVNISMKAPTGIFNVGTGKETSVLELWNLLQKNTKITLKPKFIERRRREDEIERSAADITKLSSIDLMPKITLEEGIKSLL